MFSIWLTVCSTAHIKATESYHRYYMILWKQYVLSHCPQLIFRHTRRHKIICPRCIVIFTQLPFPSHHSATYSICISWHVCVCKCLCLCDHVCMCSLKCDAFPGIEPSSPQEASGQPSCPQMLKEAVLYYTLLKYCHLNYVIEKRESVNRG